VCSYETASGQTHWKVYGPDLNGRYGGLQGTGGLEATIVDSSKATKGVINDYFGNGVASVADGSVTWFATHVGCYGPLPGVAAETLTDITRVAEATAWRNRRIDPTGFYYLGARYYEPESGRFLSVDPLGHAASRSLYDFCNGDPVNGFDPDGRCPDNTQPSTGKLVWDTVKEVGSELWQGTKDDVNFVAAPFVDAMGKWHYIGQELDRVAWEKAGFPQGLISPAWDFAPAVLADGLLRPGVEPVPGEPIVEPSPASTVSGDANTAGLNAERDALRTSLKQEEEALRNTKDMIAEHEANGQYVNPHGLGKELVDRQANVNAMRKQLGEINSKL
jgi:RHS repeat-associated protein